MMEAQDIGDLKGPVLLFGGVYSNLEALLALRAEAGRRGIPPANVICTGDTPGYCADPAACLDLVEEWGIHAIAGNVETNLVNGTDDCGCGFGDGSRCDMFAKLWYDYAARHVTGRNLAYMAKLPDMLRFNYAGKRMVVLHGSPDNQSEFVWRSTPAKRKAAFREAVRADVVIGGHCGLPFAQRLPRAEPIEDRESGIENRQSFWLNPGVIGMPANDGTPRTWFAVLNDEDGLGCTFHALDYDHRAAKAKMIDDRRLPVAYAATLTTGVWDNTEIMPAYEESLEGRALDAAAMTAEFTNALDPSVAPAPPPPETAAAKSKIMNRESKIENPYANPKDLKSFGKIAEWQEEMGEKFFDWYSGVTEGDTALTAREKALIALAVSHAIQCSYCIEAYTTNSLQSGADEEQMMEAVHVAAAVKAGTTLIYARQMQRQVDKVVM